MREDVKKRLFIQARKLQEKIVKDAKQSLLNSYDLGVIYHKLELGGALQKEIAQHTLQKSEALLRNYLKLVRGLTRRQLIACFECAKKYGEVLEFHTAVSLVYAMDKLNDTECPADPVNPLKVLKITYDAHGRISINTLKRVGEAAATIVRRSSISVRVKTRVTTDATKIRRMLEESRRMRSQLAKLSHDKHFALELLNDRNALLSVRADAEAFLAVMDELKSLITITANRRSRVA